MSHKKDWVRKRSWSKGITVRGTCSIPGCKNLMKYKKKHKDGTWTYENICQRHFRMKYGYPMNSTTKKMGLEMSKLTSEPCSKCGWNESYCDVHRIVEGKEGGKYELNNVIVLCPNCHRELHQGAVLTRKNNKD